MDLFQTLATGEFNARNGVRTFAGLPVRIEVPAGGIRKGVDSKGVPWSVRLPYAYGKILHTKGVDGESVDCFLGPNPNSKIAYVIAIPEKWGNEDKVMLGFDTKSSALRAFLYSYSNQEKFVGGVSTMTVLKLQKRLESRKGRRLASMQAYHFEWSMLEPVPSKGDGAREKEKQSLDDIQYELELTRRQGTPVPVNTTLTVTQPIF